MMPINTGPFNQNPFGRMIGGIGGALGRGMGGKNFIRPMPNMRMQQPQMQGMNQPQIQNPGMGIGMGGINPGLGMTGFQPPKAPIDYYGSQNTGFAGGGSNLWDAYNQMMQPSQMNNPTMQFGGGGQQGMMPQVMRNRMMLG